MKHLRLSALAFAVMLTAAACGGNSRSPIYYPGGGPRPTVVDRDRDGYDDRTGVRIDSRDRNGDGYDDRTGARIEGNKRSRNEVRCNAGNGNGNGNGRCRNGNRGRGNGNGKGRGGE
ncbi:MAG TPA: hypothetical protein VF142_20635 [Longimicrobium sp.]